MKKIAFIGCAFVILITLWMMRQNSNQVQKKERAKAVTISATPGHVYSAHHFVFVPSWSFSKEITTNPSDTLIYFGITADTQGISTTDSGYAKISTFKEAARDHQTYLAVQMIDSDINSLVLQDSRLQDKIVDESTAVAHENGFEGIVVDFETSSLSFESVTRKISTFMEKFATRAHTQNLQVAIALYGDTFYRVRPYDVALLSKQADTILVMSYDFTKARSNPGPNFPLNGYDTYGYDFKHMVSDFSKAVPPQKLAIIFGMFGYDWPIDDQERSTKNGVPSSTLDITQNYIANCHAEKCKYTVDQDSSETKVEYTDTDSIKHIVWFETMDSVAKKKTFLESQGINSSGYWAYSYY